MLLLFHYVICNAHVIFDLLIRICSGSVGNVLGRRHEGRNEVAAKGRKRAREEKVTRERVITPLLSLSHPHNAVSSQNHSLFLSPDIFTPACRHALRCASASSRPGDDASPIGPTELVFPAGVPLQDHPSGQPVRRFIMKYSCRTVNCGALAAARLIISSNGARLLV